MGPKASLDGCVKSRLRDSIPGLCAHFILISWKFQGWFLFETLPTVTRGVKRCVVACFKYMRSDSSMFIRKVQLNLLY